MGGGASALNWNEEQVYDGVPQDLLSSMYPNDDDYYDDEVSDNFIDLYSFFNP